MKLFGKSKILFSRKKITIVFVDKNSLKGCKLIRDTEIIRDNILDLISPTSENVHQ